MFKPSITFVNHPNDSKRLILLLHLLLLSQRPKDITNPNSKTPKPQFLLLLHVKSAHKQSPSPTPTPHQTTPTPVLLPKSHSGSPSDSGSDLENEVRAGLKRLELQPQCGSRSQSPHAGPHSRQRALRPRGGAKDVWVFFEKVSGWHPCLVCK